jgi:protein-disulfide isomerase
MYAGMRACGRAGMPFFSHTRNPALPHTRPWYHTCVIQQSEQLMRARRKKRKRLLIGIGALVLTIIAIPAVYLGALTFNYYGKIRSGEMKSLEDRRMQRSISLIAANANVTQEDVDRLKPVGLAPEIGSRNARVTVVEFVDYQCPYCKEVALPVRRVMEGMGDRVHFVVRHFPIPELYADARNAALAANCVLEQGQKAYWRYSELLFADQERHSLDGLRQSAVLANINVARFDECMAERRYDLKIDRDMEVGRQAGVQGTPTFFVNGVKYEGVFNEKELTQIINYFLESLPQ